MAILQPDGWIRLDEAGSNPLVNWHLLGYLGFISPTLAPERVEACLLAGKASRASSNELLKLKMSGMKLPA